MIPEAGRLGLRIGLILVIPSAIMLFFQQPGTATWSITALTLIIGVVFTAAVAVAIWFSSRG